MNILIIAFAKLALSHAGLRQRAFFHNQEGTFGSQEGMITWCWLAEQAGIKLVSRFKRNLKRHVLKPGSPEQPGRAEKSRTTEFIFPLQTTVKNENFNVFLFTHIARKSLEARSKNIEKNDRKKERRNKK